MPLPEPDLDQVLDEIPVEYRDRFDELLQAPAVDAAALRRELEDYLRTVRQVGPLVAFIDVDEAERIGRSVGALIEALGPAPAPATARVVQAATRYFVQEEEDEEVTGVLGFDDDIQVLNAVCRALGRADLVVPLVRPDR